MNVPAPPRRRKLAILLPVIWVATSLISFEHPGDEYGLYFVSNILGAWLAMILEGGDIRDFWVRGSVALAGGAVTALLGWLLDRLRMRVDWFAIIWAVLGGLLLYSLLAPFDSIEEATQKNGSITAYVVASSNLAMTFTLFLCVFGASAWRARDRWRGADL